MDHLTEVQKEILPQSRMSYGEFLEERRRIVEARQRAQQRTDQLITTGAAGALVLSITFLDTIAPSPATSSRPFLISAWLILVIALGLNLASHLLSQRAFDDALAAFDSSFLGGASDSESLATRAASVLAWASASAFVVGIAFLALFALVNVAFTGTG